jgi:hypothetical protein
MGSQALQIMRQWDRVAVDQLCSLYPPVVTEYFQETLFLVQSAYRAESVGNGTEEQVLLIHALSVGLAVVDLATQRPHSKRRVEAILESLFATLALKDKKQ